MKKVHGFKARAIQLVIHKADGEYRVRLYMLRPAAPFLLLSGECFTDDLHDARATAAAQLRWAKKELSAMALRTRLAYDGGGTMACLAEVRS